MSRLQTHMNFVKCNTSSIKLRTLRSDSFRMALFGNVLPVLRRSELANPVA